MGLVRRWWWLGLLGFALLTLGAGVVLERVVAAEIEAGLVHELTTIRDLNVAALKEWLQAVKRGSQVAASDAAVRQAALELFRSSANIRAPEELNALPQQAALRARLGPIVELWKLDDYVLFTDGRSVAGSTPALVGFPVPDSDVPEAVQRGETALDLPHKPKVAALGTHKALMWVVSPIKADEGAIRGGVALRIEPEKTFTRLLRTARFGDSGETYAFTRDGTLISASRFEDELRRSGLLREGQSSVLNVSAVDPGEEVANGGAAHANGPLTRAAAAAARGAAGVDVSGYRDYRGALVVGAWTWLEEYGFGVTTEIDRAEAYRSSAVIRRASRGLTALILACTLVIGVGSAAFRRLDRRVERAERLGQYTLEKKIGEGGMGMVYRARHALLRRPTAIKVLKHTGESDPSHARFEREVQVMASLANPNTVAVYDYGRTSEGTFYYAMEYLEGRSLEDLVEASGPLPQARVIHILLQMLGSLGEAHERGLVHRDVKPDNVMLCRRGGLADLVKVVDFGLVKDFKDGKDGKLTQTNTILGTPLYMAPESIQDPEAVDHRSDLYAVGAVAYFLLAGRPVFEANTLVALFSKHMIEAPVSLRTLVPGVVPELDALVLEALAKAQDDRPASARAMVERLEALRDIHELRWGQRDASDWWDAHPIAARHEASAPGTSATMLAIDLDGRSGARSAEGAS